MIRGFSTPTLILTTRRGRERGGGRQRATMLANGRSSLGSHGSRKGQTQISKGEQRREMERPRDERTERGHDHGSRSYETPANVSGREDNGSHSLPTSREEGK